MFFRKVLIPGLILLSLSLLVTACQSSTVSSTPVPNAIQAPTTVPPTPTITPVPERSLVVCLGQEPQTLYAYGSSSRSMWSVLEAVYDGPFDTGKYSVQPVILEKLPSLSDGSAKIQAVALHTGDEIVDYDGNINTLGEGVKYFPAGCTSADCAAVYDGLSEVQLDQMTATFKLKPGLKWSDGAPLTAADSVFSYNLAASEDTPVVKTITDRTAQYKALDDLTVQWAGKPGYVPSRYMTNFWLPFPEHVLKGMSARDILANDNVNNKPVGWGPYIVQEWTKGDHITLKKNPNYFRAAEGLPKFDHLVFRFLGSQDDNALAALQTGECDVVDTTTLAAQHLDKILDAQKTGKIQISVGLGPEWEHIELGVTPVDYDNPNSLPEKRNVNFFGDLRVRKAFAYCMDRQTVINKVVNGQSPVADSYLPPDHPQYAKDLQQYPYDPARGSSLLDEVGWRDDDNNPSTPRKAFGVPLTPDGTPLEVEYLTTEAEMRIDIANRLADSAKACGIQIHVTSVSPDTLYMRGPDGQLFGRRFDMAEFSWQTDTQSPCFLYDSEQIPTQSNHWIGANVAGYKNAAFDAACKTARQLLPDQPGYAEKNAEVQTLFAQDLPAIPLYFTPKIAAARPDLCGLAVDVTTRSALWNLEIFDFGDTCKQ
jgi:peptide/nickel transport system substrate-binding protein